MALTLKQTALEWFNPESYNLIGAINYFITENTFTTCRSIAIRDNYDIIYYINIEESSNPSGTVIGNLLTIMSVDSGYVSHLKVRRSAIGETGDIFLIVEFINPRGKYEYKMLCCSVYSRAINLKFIDTHNSNSISNVTEIIFSGDYIGFLFDLTTIYTYHKVNIEYTRYQEADNTNFSNVVENISNYIDTISTSNAKISAGFTYNNETISFGRFDCDGLTWSLDAELTVPISQGQYFIMNNSSFLSAGMDSLIYFINYSNNSISLVSVNPETFLVFEISSIESNTPINDKYNNYIYNPETPGLISLISNQAFTKLIQVVNETPTFTATFRNYDNTLLYETEVNQGETPTYIGPIPTRQGDNLYDYTFSGWSPELAPITQDTTYIAQFTAVRKQVQVTFKNYDGTILEQKNIDKGTEPTYTGETPTRPSDNYYTYEFTGWTPELNIILSDTTYTATYENTLRTYVCTFKDYDGTTIDTQTITAGEYATTPDFQGTQNGYTFTGWNPDPINTQILNDTTFNAVYVKGIAINLYVNTAENDRVDKSNYLNQVGTLVGVFKEETSVMNPEIIIEYGIIDFNYIYIPVLNRYYYVNEIVSVRNNLWKIRLNCDVLMSFKSEILNLECYVSRNEYTYNEYIEDTFLPLEYDRQVSELYMTIPSDLTDYQFNNNEPDIFINTIYSGSNVSYKDRELEIVPYNVTPSGSFAPIFRAKVHSIGLGASNFRISQLLSFSNLDITFDTLCEKIINDNTLASYILSIVALPINTKGTIWPVNSQEGAGEDSLLYIKDDSTSSAINIGRVTQGFTNVFQPFINNKFTITGIYGNFLDYEPYTKYEVYLPFYGYVELKSYEVLNKLVYIVYLLQPDSPIGMVYLVTEDKILFTAECSVGVTFPISTSNQEIINREKTANTLNTIMGTVIGAGSTAVGIATKNPLGTLIGTQQMIGSITSGISRAMTLLSTAKGSSGSGSNNMWLSIRPRIRRTYPEIAVDDLEKYAKYIGRPLQENYTLNELNGYTIVGGVHVENIGLATEEEKTEIERILRSGFILPDPETT